MRNFLNWLYSHGTGLAFSFIITVVLAVCTSIMLAAVFLASVWEKIR